MRRQEGNHTRIVKEAVKKILCDGLRFMNFHAKIRDDSKQSRRNRKLNSHIQRCQMVVNSVVATCVINCRSRQQEPVVGNKFDICMWFQLNDFR
jgi:hypothetical protein